LLTADVAVEAGDVVLVRSDPRDVPRIIALSRVSYRKMMQNLWSTAGYNIVAIPLAAGVLAGTGDSPPARVCRSPDVGKHGDRGGQRTTAAAYRTVDLEPSWRRDATRSAPLRRSDRPDGQAGRWERNHSVQLPVSDRAHRGDRPWVCHGCARHYWILLLGYRTRADPHLSVVFWWMVRCGTVATVQNARQCRLKPRRR
jgi:hypothetical protein